MKTMNSRYAPGFSLRTCLTTGVSLLFTFCVLLCIAIPASGQESSPAKLPDAPSQSASSQAQPAAPISTGIGVVDLLMQRSLFFPDLATTTTPLSSGDKFKLFVSSSISGSAVLGSLAGAGFAQAFNTPEGYGQGGEGYAKRFGSSMARNASNQFFGTFLLASALHQDPRFFVKSNPTLKEAIGLSVRRVFITPTDSGGEAFNWSGLVGPLMGESLAITYMPEGNKGVGDMLGRYGTDIGVRAGTNVLRQYWPTIVKKLHLPHSQTTTAPAASRH
jgi:hypothetical protein